MLIEYGDGWKKILTPEVVAEWHDAVLKRMAERSVLTKYQKTKESDMACKKKGKGRGK